MTTDQLIALGFPLLTAAAVGLTGLFIRRPWSEPVEIESQFGETDHLVMVAREAARDAEIAGHFNQGSFAFPDMDISTVESIKRSVNVGADLPLEPFPVSAGPVTPLKFSARVAIAAAVGLLTEAQRNLPEQSNPPKRQPAR